MKKTTFLSFVHFIIVVTFFLGLENVTAQCTDFAPATPYNSDNSNKGVMFNVIANATPVTITSFDFNMIGFSTGDFEVYYKAGGYQGAESNAAAWTLIGTATNVAALGTNAVTPVPLAINVVIPAGTTYGFYFTNNNSAIPAGIRYTNNSGPTTIASDANISIYGGVGKAYPFGANYNNRSVNCTVHYRIGDLSNVTALATSNASATIANQNNAGTSTYAADCSKLIAKVLGSGVSPISGNTSAKVWIEGSQPTNYVKRHYEIAPTTNPTTATGDVTLYFTQQDFDDYNAINILKLPSGPSDTSGKANLLVELMQGTSSTGLPTSYGGANTTIDPNDSNIVWDAVNNYWKVTFATTGFGGYFIKTNATTLEVKDNFANTSFQIYPNPTNSSSFITIENLGISNKMLEVLDIHGRILFAKKLYQDKEVIDITALTTGLYFFKIDADKSSVITKIIKN